MPMKVVMKNTGEQAARITEVARQKEEDTRRANMTREEIQDKNLTERARAIQEPALNESKPNYVLYAILAAIGVGVAYLGIKSARR